ncbi:hypothetical protein NM208_g9377 [Fusarium decemcellulare]|uniref:Uncharacterized protein n=1 Tax=Fusarium decemcellulare TaxID=57161 RepID=A0ACC1S1S3_9HYPO|nr:hypothetical protein NM208_g9377 [Fusarium decemcellulare]
MLLTNFSILSSLLAMTVAAQAPDLSGKGHVLVLNGTGGMKDQTVADRIGCLDAEGFLTLDDCAVFSDVQTRPKTSAGECNFEDEDQPVNTDSHYGKSDHAFHCYPGAEAQPWPFYSVNGLSQPFMGNGNINFAYDVNRAPVAGERLPVWEYRWGSQQMGITPGHLQALFYWDKLEE